MEYFRGFVELLSCRVVDFEPDVFAYIHKFKRVNRFNKERFRTSKIQIEKIGRTVL